MADKQQDAPMRKHPSTIPRLFESKETAKIRQAHVNYYGFDISDQWAHDLGAFLSKPGPLPAMLTGSVADVQAEIKSVYGFGVTEQYVVDLMAYAKREETHDVPKGTDTDDARE